MGRSSVFSLPWSPQGCFLGRVNQRHRPTFAQLWTKSHRRVRIAHSLSSDKTNVLRFLCSLSHLWERRPFSALSSSYRRDRWVRGNHLRHFLLTHYHKKDLTGWTLERGLSLAVGAGIFSRILLMKINEGNPSHSP